ncbi:CDP-glycerol glycerophosphotransferase family protein [Neobacillus novalis]|uniref:CDP-glycerol glycerophosphotransferase family protein n=1 Tax=Neobacillus novalis TaxID=220687 RepID=A0AA95SCF1_9BACI|nr:CDP-glycerol glycerophosphotransferase family protein [Neobacillus novalis]WHY86098.1 CDP-glycerol glycerophosphotransferase family protein [Neobacillus novalis]
MNKKIIKRKINFIVAPMLNYFFKKSHNRVNLYAKYYDQLKVEKNTILYESRDGNSITDNPYAMFTYMLENPDFKDYQHIWSVADFDAVASVMAKYQDYHNVKFVKRNSRTYLKYLATSEYLINNSTFQSFFIPKKDQVYINTWHGTPLKSMGFDIPGNPAHSQNVVRNFLSTNYMLSPNTHTTKIFTDSYKLDGLYKGTIIEEGYPRIDLTLNTDPEGYKGYLRKLGLRIDDDKKTILYAPTWKGTNTTKVKNDVLQIIADINYVEKEVGDRYSILIKVHPYLYKEAAKYPELNDRLVPDFVDPNELLAAIDLLITDYSSIFFDFLVTNKPIVFYTWDIDVYGEERGQYIQNDELPGPIVYNSKELAAAIKNIETHKVNFLDNYKKMQDQFTRYDDGNVTERVVRFLFDKGTKDLNLVNKLDIQKKKLLIYPGGLRNNGITSSFINLMNNIDFDQYDVSCFTGTPNSEEVLNNLEKINKNVRFLFKPGYPVYKLLEIYRDRFIHNRGERGWLGKLLFPEKAYARDHARLFGNSKFDYVIDFSGYSLFWAKYLIVADAKTKICYMHNDLLSESEKIIDGKRPHKINLRGLFSVYHRFDKLVSVSKGTMELNRKNLLEYAPFEKFDYILNSINPEKILQNDHPTEAAIDEKNDPLMATENFKAIALLQGNKEQVVWNMPPGNGKANQFPLAQEFKDAEIIISRKASDGQNTYYKFSHNNRIIGWISSEAVELLPDTILSKQNVDKIAKLGQPRGNDIWSAPYEVPDCQKVSSSRAFKDMIVDIDQEAETFHGIYFRISIHDTVIGWIDHSALRVYRKCTIDGNTSEVNKHKINLIRNLLRYKYNNRKKELIKKMENSRLEEMETASEPASVNESQVSTGAEHDLKLGMEIDHKFIPYPAKNDVNFVTMGRLSPEKGQDNLIKAFAGFHQKQTNSKLYILGHGPLKEELQALIEKLDLHDAVYLLGQIENPFSFLKKCDCFVLSSHYEGQPMVLLEAMTLEMDIIATDIVANRTVLEDGVYGLLVENSISGLEEGLNLMASDKKPRFKKFDYNQYNAAAMESFYKCLESEGRQG